MFRPMRRGRVLTGAFEWSPLRLDKANFPYARGPATSPAMARNEDQASQKTLAPSSSVDRARTSRGLRLDPGVLRLRSCGRLGFPKSRASPTRAPAHSLLRVFAGLAAGGGDQGSDRPD